MERSPLIAAARVKSSGGGGCVEIIGRCAADLWSGREVRDTGGFTLYLTARTAAS